MDFGRAFSYVFQDPNWLKKVAIAAVLNLIPLIGSLIVLGWGLEITHRVINNDSELLPEWNDIGGFLGKGFQAFVVTLVFLLPSLLINICHVSLVTYGANAQSNQFNAVISVAGICLSCFNFLFSVGASFVIPAAIGTLAETGQMSAALRFNQVFSLVRTAPGPYLLQLVVVGVASVILVPVGFLICFVGVLFSLAYMTLISCHLTGQSYKLARAAQRGLASAL
jgi:hypothetical protein